MMSESKRSAINAGRARYIRMAKLIAVLFILSLTVGFAQKPTDQIHMNGGSIIAAKVIEITTTEVKYKKASNPDGPTYTVPKSDIAKIVYANGEEETYTAKVVQKSEKKEVSFEADNFITFSPDGKRLITDLTMEDGKTYLCYWGFDLKIKSKILFDNRTEYQGLYNWQMMTNAKNYLHKGSLYDSVNNKIIDFINPKTGKPFEKDSKGNIISSDGRRVLIKTTENVGKGPMYLFDEKGGLLKTISIGVTGVGAWKFSPSGKYFLMLRGNSLSKKGGIYVYDADGNSVGEIELADAWNDYKYYPYNNYGYLGYKEFMDFSFDDKFVISPRDAETVGLWDIKGNLVRTYPHFHPKVAAISHDGNTVVTVGALPYGKEETLGDKVYKGGFIKIWSVDGTLQKEISFPLNPSSVAFLPNDTGFVVTSDGVPLWFWKKDGYTLGEEYSKVFEEVAKSQETARAAQRANEKRERHSNLWGGLATGLVLGLAKADGEMAKSNMQKAEAEKFINATVNQALTDCHYVVFTRITKDDDLAVSDIFKITRGCNLNSSGANVKFADTKEELNRWIKMTIAKEDKENDRDAVPFDEMNKHFGSGALAGQGGCLCK